MGQRWFRTARIFGLATIAMGGQVCAQGVAANPALDAASEQIGRALFLRCLCAGDTLHFDAAGEPVGAVKTTDWTLAAVDIDKVEAKTASGDEAGGIELDGVRVAIHYADDRHEFERKPQKDERVRILIADAGDAAKMRLALAAVFAQGIDRKLQQSLPEMWQHYFEPGKAWPNDELSGQTIFNAGVAVGNGDAKEPVTEPVPVHKVAADSTPAAMRNHVQGTVVLRMVVDADGVPRRVAIAQPLGYGLDAQAAAAAAKMRFKAGALGGKPVAVAMYLREDFVLVPRPD